MKEGAAAEGVGVLAAGTGKAMGVPEGPEDVVAAGKYQQSLFAVVLEQDQLLESQSAGAAGRGVADQESRLAAEQDLLEGNWVAESPDFEQKTRGIDTLAYPVPTETL